MHHSPVAILQNKRHGREYRASSLSHQQQQQQGQGQPGHGQGHQLLGTSAGTPSSLSNSYIDHAFDHPTPTSFSQLQFLSSSVASNDGSDYTHRVPKVEEKFCSGFHCCGMELDDLHHLLEHFEECHVPTGGQPDPNAIPVPLPGSATGHGHGHGHGAAFDSSSSSASNAADTPQFDDFDEEEAERQHHHQQQQQQSQSSSSKTGSSAGNAAGGTSQPGMQMQSLGAGQVPGNGSGTGPTLSAPPSPAMSSYSDTYPAGHGNGNGGNSTSAGHPLYELKNKRRSGMNNSSQSSFGAHQHFRTGKSRSPPSGGEQEMEGSAASMAAGNDTGDLPFTRRARQQSVDSVASVSTNASTSSRKRSFNAAMGGRDLAGNPNNNPIAGNGGSSSNLALSALSQTRGRPGGIDLTAIRGGSASAISTPESSVPGTPASDYVGASTSEMIDSGCLPPSLLFPLQGRSAFGGQQQGDDEDMTTDEEEEEEEDGSEHGDGGDAGSYAGYEFDDSHYDENEDADGDEGYEHFAGMGMGLGMDEYGNLSNMQMLQGGSGGSGSSSTGAVGSGNKRAKGNNKNKRNRYDNNSVDMQAAAMFSPLSLLSGSNTTTSASGPGNHHHPSFLQQHYQRGGSAHPSASSGAGGAGAGAGGGNILLPTVSDSSSPNAQAHASAATLAAIQAAAASSGINTGSTPTGRVWIPNNAKPFKCPVPGCDKAYKQQNGLKYHRLHGHCNANATGKEGEEPQPQEEDKPFGCYVGPACGKKYKNMNGLRYHYQHSGAHGQIGLQMLQNGTHPPPAYPPGHKRSSASKANVYSEFASTSSPTVVMNQSTAEALLAAISHSSVPGNSPMHSQPGSRSTSRPATPRIGTPSSSRATSPNASTRQRTSPQRQASMSSFPSLPLGMGFD